MRAWYLSVKSGLEVFGGCRAWPALGACELVEKNVTAAKADFASWLDGNLAEAKRQSGDNCAVGRLGVVKKEVSAPRLIGDSSISSANHLCRISEKAEMPSLADVSQFLSRRQGERWIAFLMDISKAHTRVNVPPKERGFSLFAVMEPGGRRRWVAYNTCRFGCSRATYGWSRSSRHLVWALPCDLRG